MESLEDTMRKTWYAQIVVTFRLRTALNMGKISSSLNANSVARLHSGFAGGILTSANPVTISNVTGST